MVEALPTAVSTFTVVGRLVKGVGDTSDAGQDIDIAPISGITVTFKPSLNPPIYTVPSASPNPVTIYQDSIVATTDANGFIKIAGESSLGVQLVYGFDTSLSPNGWTWDVTIDVGGNFPVQTFSIMGSDGGVVDLSTVIPVPANIGADVLAWQAVLVEVDQALDEIVVTVPAQLTWTGAVSLSQAQTKAKYLRARLTGNTVLTLVAGELSKAYSCSLELAQDGTGSRTIVIANAVTSYGVPIVLSTVANSVDIVRLEWNGSRWAAFLGGSQFSIPTAWVV